MSSWRYSVSMYVPQAPQATPGDTFIVPTFTAAPKPRRLAGGLPSELSIPGRRHGRGRAERRATILSASLGAVPGIDQGQAARQIAQP